MPTCLRTSTPRAKKAHRCMTCQTMIQPGTTYSRDVYLGDDGLYEWLACMACKEIGPVVWEWVGESWEGYTDEDMIEWARDQRRGEEWLDPRAKAFLERLCESLPKSHWLVKEMSA